MSSDHSRRLAFDTPSGSRKSARTSIDSTSGSTLRSSYLEHPLDTCQNPSYDAPPINEPTEISRYHEGRDSQNNFRTSSVTDSSNAVTVYETSSYQNVNSMPQPSLNSSAFISAVNYDKDTNQQQRHHSNSDNSNYTSASNAIPSSVSPPPLRNFRYNSHSFSLSPPPALNYQQRLHDIPTISILSSPSYQQQGQNNLSSPLLSPSSFLWSNNNNEKPAPQRQPSPPPPPPPPSSNRPETPPSMLTSSYTCKQTTTMSHTETPVGNESSRYFDNKLVTHNDSLYFQQPSSNIRQYNNNPIMNSQNNITIPKYVTDNKNTSFY
ncbi:hypothetical protein HPULCUR_008312 [Helicostylum pulchrum]|uniref:Uncharacterized protein n=1 Tax=Helicostylum pulchrum TaxID=562976 RepID=A0ABP9Y964_9FUNG